jgi:hypothetical protein
MTEQPEPRPEKPEQPAQPGVDTHLLKDAVAAAQAALDATYNEVGGRSAQEVEGVLRQQLAEHGTTGDVPQAWLTRAAERIAAGEQVRAEPGDA